MISTAHYDCLMIQNSGFIMKRIYCRWGKSFPDIHKYVTSVCHVFSCSDCYLCERQGTFTQSLFRINVCVRVSHIMIHNSLCVQQVSQARLCECPSSLRLSQIDSNKYRIIE